MSFGQSIERIMSGEARGVGPALSRALLSIAEPIYRIAMNSRNRRFDRDPSRIRRLPKPVVSIGNLTTGGTGKTPIIRWLAGALRDQGLRVGILSRGYKAAPGSLGDEQRMLQAMLGDGVAIECDPDRFAAGGRLLERSPDIDLCLLDDGFQHRRLHRDLDIVLLHAGEPFGYGHVLPRGMLREPVASLKRADAIIVTNVSREGQAASSSTLITEVKHWNPASPIFFERHEPVGLRSASVLSSSPPDHALSDLTNRKVFVFSGLGSPVGFERQIESLSAAVVGRRRFADHHDYTPADLAALQHEASAAGADLLVTTEKDWVKLAAIEAAKTAVLPIWRLDIAAQFLDNGGEELLGMVRRITGKVN
jgi:tetraacyldisaccharide 4'-kinase